MAKSIQDGHIVRNEYDLFLRRVAATTVLGRTMLESIRFSVENHPALDGLVYNLEAEVLSDKIAEDSYTAYFYWKEPATWFQHLKQEHGPAWFLRRFPVRLVHKKAKRTIGFTRWAQYPKANVAIDKKSHVFLETLGGLETLRDEVRT